MTPQLIIEGAIHLITKHGWRKSIYTTVGKDKNTTSHKEKILYHTHDMPCFMCGTKLPITGITVSDALLKSFNTLDEMDIVPSWGKGSMRLSGKPLYFGDICKDKEGLRKTLQDADRPLFDAKCLLARMDNTIHIREVDKKDGFLYPLYIDLPEWNDRKDQTKEHILHTLELALIGNVP